jgi:hypothetical protein
MKATSTTTSTCCGRCIVVKATIWCNILDHTFCIQYTTVLHALVYTILLWSKPYYMCVIEVWCILLLVPIHAPLTSQDYAQCITSIRTQHTVAEQYCLWCNIPEHALIYLPSVITVPRAYLVVEGCIWWYIPDLAMIDTYSNPTTLFAVGCLLLQCVYSHTMYSYSMLFVQNHAALSFCSLSASHAIISQTWCARKFLFINIVTVTLHNEVLCQVGTSFHEMCSVRYTSCVRAIYERESS